MKRTYIFILIIVIALASVYFYTNRNTAQTQVTDAQDSNSNETTNDIANLEAAKEKYLEEGGVLDDSMYQCVFNGSLQYTEDELQCQQIVDSNDLSILTTSYEADGETYYCIDILAEDEKLNYIYNKTFASEEQESNYDARTDPEINQYIVNYDVGECNNEIYIDAVEYKEDVYTGTDSFVVALYENPPYCELSFNGEVSNASGVEECAALARTADSDTNY